MGIEHHLFVVAVQEERGRGKLITILELLSPSNKSGRGLIAYKNKRFQFLQAGVALVEIDLLHE